MYQIHGWQRIKAIYLSQLMPSLKTYLTCHGILLWKSGVPPRSLDFPHSPLASTSITLKCIWIRQPFLWTMLWVARSRDAVSFMGCCKARRAAHEYGATNCAMQPSSLRVKNITKSFGNTVVLDDFPPGFERGVQYSEPSGAGKNKHFFVFFVVLKWLIRAGLKSPDAKTVMMFQEDRLLENLKALWQISYLLYSCTQRSKNSARGAVLKKALYWGRT